MTRLRVSLLFALALALSLSVALSSSPVAAQSSDPNADRRGTVTGQLRNGTNSSAVPGGLALMLHAWDASGETLMLDGQVDASGAFRMEDVPMQDGWVFAAMVQYGGVTFYSDTAEVAPGATQVELPFTLYETTASTAAVRITQMHTFLEFVDGDVMIGQVYVLSNLGDRVVSGGIALADGSPAALEFGLPAGASGVRFEGGEEGRFVPTEAGFADRAPLMPGESSGQVVVSFFLPYESGMTLPQPVFYPVAAANVIVRAAAGVVVEAPGLGQPEIAQMGDGENYNLYVGGGLESGASLELTVSGEPVWMEVPPAEGGGEAAAAGAEAGEPVAAPAAPASGGIDFRRYALPAGAAVFGLALIAAGVWWLLRATRPELQLVEVPAHAGLAEDEPLPAPAEPSPPPAESVLTTAESGPLAAATPDQS